MQLLDNTTGSFNTAIGVDALDATNGSDLTCIGYDCSASRDELQNATAIGAHAMVTVSNAVVLGSIAGVNGATATARVGIGTTNPTNLLTLGQGLGPSISDGWTTYSSRRWKNNIQPLNNALGMVEQLRGVSYDLKDSGKHEIGVIAEEVGEVVPEVVSYEQNGKDARGVDYSRLTALLIEAVKQQQQQIKAQHLEITRLSGKVGVWLPRYGRCNSPENHRPRFVPRRSRPTACHLNRGSPWVSKATEVGSADQSS